MNLFEQAFAWIFSPERLVGTGALPIRILEHLYYTSISLLIAAVIAIPLGWWIGHTGRGREVAVALSGAARALPSFGLILFLVLVIGVLRIQAAAITAFVLLAIPSILAAAYAGLQAIDRHTIDAARAVGMTEWQILWKVEVPLGLPLLMSGLRSGALQVVATAILAAYVGLGGLGYDIIQGLELRRIDQTLGAALVVVALALAIDLIFAIVQRLVVPRGVTSARTNDDRAARSKRRAVVETTTA